LALSVALLVFCGSAQAATFTVDNSGDAGDATLNGTCLTAGGACTLRAAIEESNFNAPMPDTITFTAVSEPTINLTGALPDIVDDLTINGPGAGALTVRRNTAAAYRILTITGDLDVAVSGLTMTNGLSDDTTTPATAGGAIAFLGTFSCEMCGGFAATAAGDGSLSLSAVTVTANTASGADSAGGGILVANGELTIADSTISNNTASGTIEAFGGGIFAGAVVLTNVTISGNLATVSGDGAKAEGGGIYQSSGSLAAVGGVISDNTASATSTSLLQATAFGGGARSQSSTTVLKNVAVSGNDATASSNGSANVRGGGLAGNFSPRFEVSGGVINDNRASATGTSAGSSATGGGVDVTSVASAALTNVTVSGNDATATGAGTVERGGGVFAYATAADVTSATVAFNEAATGANLAARLPSGIMRVRNTIVSDPVDGTNCGEVEGGDIISDGFDLSSDTSCGFTAGGDQQSVNPDLGLLANNGGPTFTRALSLSSAAVDQGSAALSGTHPALTTDQRGDARPAEQATVNAAGGDGSDIGAFELQAPTAGYALTVSTTGSSGQGYVDSSPVGIDCGTFAPHNDCANDYTSGQSVTLAAHASTGSTFAGFSGGGCTGTAPCVVAMTQARSVTATFTLNQYALTVTTTGSSGQGYVDSSPSGIDCGFAPHTGCSSTYNHGQTVTLTAHASVGSTFAGFTGGCTGTAPCAVAMTQARSVTATFTLNQYALTVTTAGSSGQGYVDSSPSGIDCGTFAAHTACSKTYNHGQSVTLTAHASIGSAFAGFSGGCTGTAPCVVAMTQARSVTATFTPRPSYSSVVLADHPQGYWRFGEASGTTARDESANHNDGTYLNGPVLGVPGALAGDANTAARLDGVNDYVRVFNSASLGIANTFTAEGWIKRATATKSVDFIVKDVQITVMNSANANQIWMRKPGVSTIARSAGGFPVDSAYHHIVVTKNASGAGTVKFYIDGGAIGTVDVSPGQVIANSTTPLTFGSSANSQADVDEFAVYDHVLTPAQIQAHYAARSAT
jgi:hypothetical protein